jgi:hypothetical protein
MTATQSRLDVSQLRTSPVLGTVVTVVGAIMMWVCTFFGLVCVALAISIWQDHDPRYIYDAVFPAIAGVVSLFAGAAGVFLFYRGRRLQAVNGWALMQRDQRPPVLYLRSFQQDDPDAESFWKTVFETANRVWTGGFLGLAGLNRPNEERALSNVMSRVGPFIAIGRPNEKLPTLGAARIYVSDNEWQKVVEELLLKARMVILRASQTPGFCWEVERVATSVSPDKVLIWLPFDGPKAAETYGRFRERMREHLPKQLPTWQKNARFIQFGPNWEPRFAFASQMEAFHEGAFGRGLIIVALRPLFKAMGIQPRTTTRKTRLLILLGVFVILILGCILLFALVPSSQ